MEKSLNKEESGASAEGETRRERAPKPRASSRAKAKLKENDKGQAKAQSSSRARGKTEKEPSDDAEYPKVYSRSEHNISRQNIDPDATKIMYRLVQSGFKAYMVGGGVRDLLLEKTPKDFDITTDATPKEIRRLFRNCRIIGRRFKLAHIYFHGNKIIEVSTFRASQDAEPSGVNLSHPLSDNYFGTEETDALRRDLTINGLFYDISTFSIIDYVGGVEDLRNGIVRMIGAPVERFAEDPVRMLRVIRHAARAGFQIEELCWRTINEKSEYIREASAVRVYDELKKDLIGGACSKILPLLHRCGLLQHLIPSLDFRGESAFGTDSPFMAVLIRMDQAPSDYREDYLRALLALIVIFSMTSDGSPDQVRRGLGFKGGMTSIVNEAFSDIPVPRRDREVITEALELLHAILETPIDRLKKAPLERRRGIQQVEFILSLLEPYDEYQDLLELIDVALSKRTAKRGNRRDDESPSEDESDHRDLTSQNHHDGARKPPRRGRRRKPSPIKT